MTKLINLNIFEAKNVICVWDENNPERNPRCGIALSNALRGFYVPRHIVVGVFDNGTTRVGGITNYSKLNTYKQTDDIEGSYEDIFCFENFLYSVDELYAAAFVRYTLIEENVKEEEARNKILKELKTSGVEISINALYYLETGEHSLNYIGG